MGLFDPATQENGLYRLTHEVILPERLACINLGDLIEYMSTVAEAIKTLEFTVKGYGSHARLAVSVESSAAQFTMDVSILVLSGRVLGVNWYNLELFGSVYDIQVHAKFYCLTMELAITDDEVVGSAGWATFGWEQPIAPILPHGLNMRTKS